MPLIVRIDVDRPYGRRPPLRHLASRMSSDFYLPRITALGYLEELERFLALMNERRARSYVFFRRCTLPTERIVSLIDAGGHVIGMHLEDSRSFETYLAEKRALERYVGRAVHAVSKHGSGKEKYGLNHYAPYEPEKYIAWAERSGMRLLLGNLEDPTLQPQRFGAELTYFPAAFWLEPPWRDTKTFTIDWLAERSQEHNLVLLVHPENVFASPDLTTDFIRLIETCQTTTPT